MAKNNPRRARLNELLTEAKSNQSKIAAIFDANDNAGRDDSPGDKDSIKALNAANEPLMKEIDELKSMLSIQDGLGDLDGGSFSHASEGSELVTRNGSTKALTLSDTVMRDESFSKFIKALGPTVRKNDSAPVEIGSFLKTLITGASGAVINTSTSGGAMVRPDFLSIVDQNYAKPLQIASLLTHGNTGSDTVEYVRQTSFTNNAAPTGEAANTTDGDTSGRAPESAAAYVVVKETVRTIPHFFPATNRALQDAPQLRTMIDEMLRYGIEEEIEAQILYGSGAGENFNGIFATPAINAQDFDTDILKSTRKARTLIHVNGHTVPTAFVLNPFDWETIDLTKDSQGRYYFGGPTAMGQKTLWGLPVVESQLLEQGVGLVANWKFGYLWDRQNSTVSISNSHNDFFVRGLNAILGEYRGVFGIVRPKAFCRIDLQSGISS